MSRTGRGDDTRASFAGLGMRAGLGVHGCGIAVDTFAWAY